MSWQGRYYDGRTAARHDVDISIESNRIVLSSVDGRDIFWPFDLIRWTEPPADHVAQLCIATAPDARLVVEQPGFAGALRQVYPGVDWAAARQLGQRRRFVTTTAMALALAAAIYGVIAFLPGLAAPLVPRPVAESVGDSVVRDIAKMAGALDRENRGRLCIADKGQAALDRLVARIAAGERTADTEAAGFKVRVVDIRVPNALAAPGGRILIFSGMLNFARSPGELAGVLAHEMAHAVHRHPLQSVLREIGIAATLDLLIGSGLAAGATGVLLRSSYSRDAEREADDTGFQMLEKAGISTTGMVLLFDRFERELPSMPRELQVFSTHPRSAERAARLARSSRTTGGPAMTDEDWQALRNICKKD